jgi:RluA family pseudouridine synthase
MMKQSTPFSIVFEDDFIVAVNKAVGISVSPDRWDNSKERLDKLVTAFLDARGTAGKNRIYTVHRIDKDTSGLVVFAKDEETHRRLSQAFEARRVEKRYIAVIHGRPSWTETDCELPLVPDGDKQHRTIIDKYQGKKSYTRFRLLGSAGNYSAAEALPETGRPHQIRVHLSGLGHPIVCDSLYGNIKPVFLSSFKRGWRGDPLEEKPLLARLGLHAAALVISDYPAASFIGNLSLNAPLVRDLAALINQMEKSAGKVFGV